MDAHFADNPRAQVAFRSTRTAEVDPKLKKIFYPLVVLLTCLPRAAKFPYKARREIDQAPSSTSSPEQLFRDFLSRLAFLCWTDITPATICACVVLSRPDITVEYVFTFNNRSPFELNELKDKIRSILDMLHVSTSSEKGQREVLRNVLSCCVKRVSCYLKAFERHLEGCIKACASEDTPDANEISQSLRILLVATKEALTTGGRGAEVDIAATDQLIWSVYRAYKSPVFELVHERVLTEERLESSTHWHELIHVAGRLMTYKQAIDVLFMVRKPWPELFQDYHITMVPSSSSALQVLNKKVLTAKEIINKTTSDESKLAELNAAAEKTERLQAFRLDDEIKKEWSKKHKDGIHVHAEINLLQYLERTEGGTEDSRFFQGIKFIGSSKPPCKLCSYFFQAYHTDVKVRPSHGNLYGTWLMPDIIPRQPNTRGESETLKVARKIRDRLRDYDLLQALRGGERDGRPHDSSNYSTRRGPRSQDRWEDMYARTEVSSVTHDTELDEAKSVSFPSDQEEPINSIVLSYIQAQASFNSTSRDTSFLSRPSGNRGVHGALPVTENRSRDSIRISSRTVADTESDDDDDGGGTLLFQGRVDLRTVRRR